jgi:hypothetical protein
LAKQSRLETLELIRFLDHRIGRWLAYADSCMNAESETARCMGFWTFVAVVLGLICVGALASVAVRMMLDRRRGSGQQGAARYKKPA